jgi:hypothetical protein
MTIVVGIAALGATFAAAPAHAVAASDSPQAPPCDWRPTNNAQLTGTTFNQDNVPIRTGEYNTCQVVNRGFVGDSVTIHCYSVNANGYEWVYLDVARGFVNALGWAPIGAVYNPSGTNLDLPHC